MLKTALIPVLLMLLAACGSSEMKDFHLVLIGEMEAFEELDEWTPVATGSVAAETTGAEQALKEHYADLMDLVRPKSVVALSRLGKDSMQEYDQVPELTEVKLTPVAESKDKNLLLLAGVWEELPKQAPAISRRLMIYPVYDRQQKKIAHMTVTIRGE
jgi:hypothetical protein